VSWARTLCLLVLLALAAEARAGDDPLGTFRQANEAYRAKDFGKALSLYRSLSERVRNPAVLYNWGNSAYKAGRLGEAILALERAHRLAPRDGDVRVNLGFLRTRVKDTIVEDDQDFVTRLLFGLLDRFSSNELAAASAVLLWVAVLIAVLAILNRRPERVAVFRLALFGALGLLLLALAPCLCKLYLEEARHEAIVLAREIAVLSGPATDEIKRFTLHEGAKVRILREWDRWVQISLVNGENGWALAEQVGRI